MNKRTFVQTKIKRSHLVMQYGVGSLIRSRQGVTALVAGLPEWDHYLMIRSDHDKSEHAMYLRKHWFREPELESATGVRRFVPPPSEVKASRTWELPLLRFPLAGSCTNWQCQRITVGNHGTPATRAWRCGHCSGARSHPVAQIPIFHACPNGHLDEIDFAGAIEHLPSCSAATPRVSFAGRIESPTIKCGTCGGSGSLDTMHCSGGRPWLPTAGPEPCDQVMEVVNRTSVKTYYANTISAIHIPLEADLNDELLSWLDKNPFSKVVDFDTEAQQRKAAQAVLDAGWPVTVREAIDHIRHFRADDVGSEEWNILRSRGHEFDILAGRRWYAALDTSPLISLSHHPIEQYTNSLVRDGAIINVRAVHKLTETRVLNGFSRITPRALSPREGRLLMWGRDTDDGDWLPGYRAHGEGIFIEFDGLRFGTEGATEVATGRNLFALSRAGTLVHTFAHLLIDTLAETAGYSVPSIRDRVYDLGDGRLAVLVYTAEGDSMGTLGGLVAHAEPDLFDSLIESVLDAASWCPQDPVCRETTHSAEHHIGAACHQCTLLPETSCELFNTFLDRNPVIEHLVRSTAR